MASFFYAGHSTPYLPTVGCGLAQLSDIVKGQNAWASPQPTQAQASFSSIGCAPRTIHLSLRVWCAMCIQCLTQEKNYSAKNFNNSAFTCSACVQIKPCGPPSTTTSCAFLTAA